jgi:hypothetical protein
LTYTGVPDPATLVEFTCDPLVIAEAQRELMRASRANEPTAYVLVGRARLTPLLWQIDYLSPTGQRHCASVSLQVLAQTTARLDEWAAEHPDDVHALAHLGNRPTLVFLREAIEQAIAMGG